MYGQQQIPSPSNAMAPPTTDPFLTQITHAFRQVADDDGLMLYTDWASPTMYDTLASNFQDLLAGKISAQDMAKNVQADWSKFDQKLQE
jgi:raffinose/stachyose/melibiose transport system substrate-binding protein